MIYQPFLSLEGGVSEAPQISSIVGGSGRLGLQWWRCASSRLMVIRIKPLKMVLYSTWSNEYYGWKYTYANELK